MDRYRFEAMFHATDGTDGREFRHEGIYAATLEEAVAAASRRAVAPPDMKVSSATLTDLHDRLVWFALPQAVEGQEHQLAAEPDAAVGERLQPTQNNLG